jgi:hypothetical protein
VYTTTAAAACVDVLEPTVHATPNFNPEDDCKALKEAMAGTQFEYTHDAEVVALCLVQAPFPVAPCQTPNRFDSQLLHLTCYCSKASNTRDGVDDPGWGCNNEAIVNILGDRTTAERIVIKQTYKTMYGKDLYPKLKGEIESAMAYPVKLMLMVRVCGPHLRSRRVSRKGSLRQGSIGGPNCKA